MKRSDQAYALAAIEYARKPPKTQADCCALAARVDVAINGKPTSDRSRLYRALGIAKGLFGPSFEAAAEAQKWAWIDMCEAALREVSK